MNSNFFTYLTIFIAVVQIVLFLAMDKVSLFSAIAGWVIVIISNLSILVLNNTVKTLLGDKATIIYI